MSQWNFDKYRPGTKKRNPIQGEFFSSEAISDPGRALVREGIQNSLDAATGAGAVLVRILISGVENARENQDVGELFKGAWDHFRAPRNGLREIPNKNERCEFLVFEDFGTTGLTGDPAEINPTDKNAFFHFFRAEGISDKGEGDRGSWGVGKTVFQRASRINTMFGLTVRHDDSARMLMGISLLKHHEINGHSYTPDGWFGSRSDDGIVLPLDDRPTLNDFCKTFSLERGTEPGLSIVVPWLDPDVNGSAVVEAVLRDYFYPILTGRLEVMINAPEIEITVSRESLDAELQKVGGELEKDIKPLIELARWSLSQDATTIPKLKQPFSRKAMQWDAELIPEEIRPILASQLISGERLAIRVPVNVREKGKTVRESFFDVFIVRDSANKSERPVFVRGGIIIPDVRAPRSRGLTSLVIVEDKPLTTFLGDAEGPAHTQWQHDGSKFKGKYVSGKLDLQFVIRSVRELRRIFAETESEEDHSLLADIFDWPGETFLGGKRPRDKDGKEPEPPPSLPLPPARPPVFVISRLRGGFTITASGSAGPDDIPSCLDVEAAYEVRRGSAFSRYRSQDFDLSSSKIDIDVAEATVVARKANRLTTQLNGKGFRITIKGFDDKRDVRVRVTPMEDYNAHTVA